MKRTLRILSSLSLSLLGASIAHARDLPNYDASAGLRAPARVAPALRASVALRKSLVASTDPRTGAPTFVWGSRTSAAPLSVGMTAEEAARAHLLAHAELYGVSAAALGTARALHVHDTGRGGILVTFRQQIGGVALLRKDVKVLLRRDLSLVAISGSPSPLAVDTPKSKGVFKLPYSGAVARALSDLYAMSVPSAALAASADGDKGEYRRFDLVSPGSGLGALRFDRPARAKRALYSLPDRLVPAYYVEVFATEKGASPDVYGYVVAADDGRVLSRQNLTAEAAFKYRVWADDGGDHRPFDGPVADFTPHPTGVPDGSAPTFVAPNLVTMDGFDKNADPWLPDGATESKGNNVDAYTDHDDSNSPTGGDVRATVTAPGEFDRTYDTSKAPVDSTDQEMAAVLQLFYTINWLHDYWYDSGFDEAAGNAQADNYGRGGLAGDRLLAEAQDAYDGGAKDNANMATPNDGESPRMQMYVWTGNEERSLATAPLAPNPETGVAEFGPPSFDVAGTVVLADDGVAVNSNACEAITSDVNGKIALVDRGSCTFHEKALNAQNAGAIGMILANNQSGSPPYMPASNFPEVTIPVLGISKADGATLKTALEAGPVSATLHRKAGVLVDGTIDNLVVSHEWGHYIHHRLVNCQLNQCGGESEGWGDFLALTTQVRATDDLDGTFSDSTYAASATPNFAYFGIRRYPYSVDMTKNPLTFTHIQQSSQLPVDVPVADVFPDNSESHNAGEVWSSMLFEGFVAILKQSKDAAPKYSFEEGRRRMVDYVVAGMKLAPPEPTFTEQRDAIIAAAYAADPADALLVAEGFAKRGAGSCAVSPPNDSIDNEGVVESYVVAPAVSVTSVTLDDSASSCDKDGELDAGEVGKVTVVIANRGYLPAPGTKLSVTSSTPGVVFPNGASASFDKLDGFTDETVSFDVKISPSQTMPAIIDLTVTAENPDACNPTVVTKSAPRVNFDNAPESSSSDDMESNVQVWAPEGEDSASIWSRDADEKGNHVWHGIDYSTISDTALVSPPLDVAATGNLVLSFQHRHSFEASEDPNNPGSTEDWDGGVIEISADGGSTWEDVSKYGDPGYTGTIGNQANNPLSDQPAFTAQNAGWPAMDAVKVDLGDSFAGKTVQIRFRIGSDEAASEHGWELDDIGFEGLAGKPFPSIVPDAQACLDHAPVANAGVDQTVESGASVTLDGAKSSDPDGDALSFTWSLVDGAASGLTSDGAKATFKAPAVDKPTVLTFALQVTANALSSTDTVKVLVQPAPGEKSDLAIAGGGCGCAVPGDERSPTAPLGALGALAIGFLAYRRRSSKR